MNEELPPEHWENCAEQVRLLAESMVVPECRQILLEIAAGYSRMARAALRFREYGGVIEGMHSPTSAVKGDPT